MFQTHTRITSSAAQKRQRNAGWASALKSVAAVMTGAQILLWITFFGYDRAQQAVWQSALLLAPVWIAVFLAWKGAGSNHWFPLALLICLQLDACLALFAFSAFISQLIPQYPTWVGVAVPTVMCFLIALMAGVRGVGYGARLFKWLLAGLLILTTVFLRASSRADRLWPILGSGIASTALCALSGAGSVWGAALIFALPKEHPPQKALRWALIPWLLGCVWALWFGFLWPWVTGDALPVAEKMLGLARHAMSVVLYELAGVLWMLLLPLALCGCAAASEILVQRALPRLPRVLPIAFALLPSCIVLLIWPGEVLAILETLLPYRALIALACGIALTISGRKEKA